MTCLYVLPLFLERAYLQSPLSQLLSSNSNSSAHLQCLDLISYFLELLLSSLQRRAGKNRRKSNQCKMQASSRFSQYLSGQIGQEKASCWKIGGLRQIGDWNLQPRYHSLRWVGELSLKPLGLFSFTFAHCESYLTF